MTDNYNLLRELANSFKELESLGQSPQQQIKAEYKLLLDFSKQFRAQTAPCVSFAESAESESSEVAFAP